MIEKAKGNNVPQKYWKTLQYGETVTQEDMVYEPHMVQGETRKGIKVGYCTDGRPNPGIVKLIQGADLFIGEGLYGELESQAQAAKYKHMIYSEAATLAKQGQVKELWLTHFSPANINTRDGLENATVIFPNTILGQDRMTKTLIFEE